MTRASIADDSNDRQQEDPCPDPASAAFCSRAPTPNACATGTPRRSPPKVDRTPGEPGYDVLDFNGFYVMLDRRDDVGETNPQPGRMFLNVETDDARSIAQRIDTLGGNWHAPLEDRGGGSLFATAIDPDGNYVQIIEFSEEARAEMESGMTDSQTT